MASTPKRRAKRQSKSTATMMPTKTKTSSRTKKISCKIRRKTATMWTWWTLLTMRKRRTNMSRIEVGTMMQLMAVKTHWLQRSTLMVILFSWLPANSRKRSLISLTTGPRRRSLLVATPIWRMRTMMRRTRRTRISSRTLKS